MHLHSSPASSPVSSPNPMTQEDSPCLSRQKAQEEIQFLSILLENTAATLSVDENRRFFDENDYAFQAELSRYRDAEASSNKVKSNYSLAEAVSNAPRPQMAPETSAQNEARTNQNYHPTPNQHTINKKENSPTQLTYFLS
ncbi:hypothetical protein NPIL_334111 [Nephila pilipes]|uniref:Uncharacterized protein n=1 Tax=Nephila pilipes TaxID=299642 RepID=A0A8X6T768_NEPPI|nr:hypothetical protein NPIL_334111 [Nephila pilipes]